MGLLPLLGLCFPPGLDLMICHSFHHDSLTLSSLLINALTILGELCLSGPTRNLLQSQLFSGEGAYQNIWCCRQCRLRRRSLHRGWCWAQLHCSLHLLGKAQARRCGCVACLQCSEQGLCFPRCLQSYPELGTFYLNL